MIPFTILTDRIVCDLCNATIEANDVRTHVCGLTRAEAIALVHNTDTPQMILSTRNPLDRMPLYCARCSNKFATLAEADQHECKGVPDG